MAGLVGGEGVDEVGDEILFFGAFFDDVFFVFNDDFGVGDFGDLAAGDGELWIRKAF